MINVPVIIDSSVAGFIGPATWNSPLVVMDAKGSTTVHFHIWWQDVAITWYLYCGNFITALTAPPWIDITAAQRAVDPGWIDPVVGDPLSAHMVSVRNPPGKYVVLGFTGGGWGGAAPLLRVGQYRDRAFTR